jgi:hypothetical protein
MAPQREFDAWVEQAAGSEKAGQEVVPPLAGYSAAFEGEAILRYGEVRVAFGCHKHRITWCHFFSDWVG